MAHAELNIPIGRGSQDDTSGSTAKALYSKLMFVVAGSATAAAVMAAGLFLENFDSILM